MHHRCESCGRAFVKKEHYSRHVRTHTRERPFSCRFCDSSFARRDTLRRHVRAHHRASEGIVSPGNGADVSGDQIDTLTHRTDCSIAVPTPDTLEDVVALAEDYAPDQCLPVGSKQSAATENAFGSYRQFNSSTLLGDEEPLSYQSWHWTDVLELDPDFNIGDIGTFNVDDAHPELPWLPLRHPDEEPSDEGAVSSGQCGLPRDLSEQWFTYVSYGPCTTPSEPAARSEISRTALANSIQRHVPDTTLPPTPFLNQCISIFTTRLWPVVPVVHLPTFQPSTTNPLLLLSICSLGALAHGSPAARNHGIRLFEAVRKAILVSWEPRTPSNANLLPIYQACLIGQTFAILSAEPQQLLIARSFQGTLSIMIRSFQQQLERKKGSMAGGISLAEMWHDWIDQQTLIRLLNVLYVHDGELAATTHQLPLLRMPLEHAVLAEPDSIFLAKSAIESQSLISDKTEGRQPDSTSRIYALASIEGRCAFSSLALLELVLAEISDRNVSPYTTGGRKDPSAFQDRLIQLSRSVPASCTLDHIQRLSLHILWHSCFLHLFCDMDKLEQACGRNGPREADAAAPSILNWVTTDEAARCVAHAFLIARHLEKFRVWDVPAIPVARAGFQTGLVLCVVARLALANDDYVLSGHHGSKFTEMRAVLSSSFLRESERTFLNEGVTLEMCKMQAFSVSTMLRHLAPWPNAKHYADTLDAVLHCLET